MTRLGRAAKASKLDMCPELVSALRSVEADILHLHVPNPTMILALLRARPKSQLVVTYHSDHVRQRFRDLVRRRIEGCPVAYLVGRKEFFSLPFEITPAVLIPRPETEFVVLECVRLAKELPRAGKA